MNGGTSLDIPGPTAQSAQGQRKRVTILEPTQQPSLKKVRVQSPTNDDENENDEETETDRDLENFRKQAIWREMKEYKRKLERSHKQVKELDQQRTQYEARLSAVDYSWELLVREADLILPSTSTAPNGHSRLAASPSVSDPSLTDEALIEALAQRSTATKALLARLTSLHPSEGDSSRQVEELQEQCRVLMEESLQSQESLRLLRVKHEETLEQLEKVHNELLRAEKKFDRVHSTTVATLEGRLATTLPVPTTGEFANGSASPAHGGASNGASPRPESVPPGGPGAGAELEELRHLVESRAREIEGMRMERVSLKLELDSIKSKLVDLPEDIIAESAPFKLLQSHIQSLTGEYDARKNELDKAIKEADGMRELQESFRQQVTREAAQEVEEVQQKLTAKEADLIRVRSQREDVRAEAAELRARESEKVKNLDQLKTLAESRHERIAALDSQVKRLQMQLAASEGDGTTVDILASGDEGVKDLQTRLKSAEELLLAMRDQLRNYASTSGASNAQNLVKSETDVRVELTKCKEQLGKLEALIGPDGSPDLRELAERLKSSEETVKKLETQLKAQDHASNMLYGEIDRLSAAWSTLDEQNSSKVFNLVGLEEKVQRLNTDKAKADSRYFATLRAKEATTAENEVFKRVSDKQQRAVEAANDARHSIGQQVHSLEKEITLHQQNVRVHQEALAVMKREKQELTMRNDMNAKHLAELNNALTERVKQAEAESAARQRVEEHAARLERELAIAKESSSSTSTTTDTAEVRNLKRDNEDLTKMLSCSTCKIRFKTNIINRCGHLFCKECIEARLANRQRKCPTCGIAFGKDDVSAVYF